VSAAPASQLTPAIAPQGPPVSHIRRRRRWVARILKLILILASLVAAIAAMVWEGKRMYTAVKPQVDVQVPTTTVKRGDLTLSVSAKGELRGGNSEILSAPLTTGNELHITFLRTTGDLVKSGDPVVEFDPTDQEFRLKEAEADLAEAKVKVDQAKSQAEAQLEEDRYSLEAAESAVRQAEFDVRKNPILGTIQARQNDLALKAAQGRLGQIRQDIGNRQATNDAAIQVQQAGVAKAEVEVATAQRNIDALTLKAKRDGYVSLRQNTSGNFFMQGMTLPYYQTGDSVRSGMAVAEIPDLKNWEISATIGELDRGHLVVGQPVDVSVVALPGRRFHGQVQDLGGTGGPPWDRHFQCKIRLVDPVPELRPGMSVNVVITTDVLKNAVWIPAQALFDEGSRTYVYVPAGNSFAPRDVKLLRRSESQVIVEGLAVGQAVALASPEQQSQKKPGAKASPLPK
jgi:HlyD family secretion protein